MSSPEPTNARSAAIKLDDEYPAGGVPAEQGNREGSSDKADKADVDELKQKLASTPLGSREYVTGASCVLQLLQGAAGVIPIR